MPHVAGVLSHAIGQRSSSSCYLPSLLPSESTGAPELATLTAPWPAFSDLAKRRAPSQARLPLPLTPPNSAPSSVRHRRPTRLCQPADVRRPWPPLPTPSPQEVAPSRHQPPSAASVVAAATASRHALTLSLHHVAPWPPCSLSLRLGLQWNGRERNRYRQGRKRKRREADVWVPTMKWDMKSEIWLVC